MLHRHIRWCVIVDEREDTDMKWNYLRVAGVVLAAFLWVHYLGLPWGLLSGATTAMLFL